MLEGTEIEVSTIMDMKRDWNQHAFSHIRVTKTDEDCRPGEEALFTSYWRGSEEGCVHDKPGSRVWVETLDEFEEKLPRYNNGQLM